MISERQQIAERFRSEGAGEAAKIIGKKEKDLQGIESEAYKEIQTIKGIADAKAADIYSTIYNRSKDSRALYGFVKTLETYQQVIDPNTTLVITTDSELYQLLNDVGD
jgi:membrane protease subunit HflC